jgi:hypothetical protein
MKHLITLLLCTIVSINGFCDTIDHWHVYINDKLIAQFNENSEDLTIKVKKTEIKTNDIITVRYGTDHPFVDCIYGLTVLADLKRKAPEVETEEHFGKLSIPFKELLDIYNLEGIDRFSFHYYWRIKNSNNNPNKLIFVLTISEK